MPKVRVICEVSSQGRFAHSLTSIIKPIDYAERSAKAEIEHFALIPEERVNWRNSCGWIWNGVRVRESAHLSAIVHSLAERVRSTQRSQVVHVSGFP